MNKPNCTLGSLSAEREQVILAFVDQYDEELVPDYEVLRCLDKNGHWDQHRYDIRDLIIPDLKAYGFIEVWEFNGAGYVEVDPFKTGKGWWELKITDAGKAYLKSVQSD